VMNVKTQQPIRRVELSRERHFEGLLVFALNSGCG
jgi:hypothetical protein